MTVFYPPVDPAHIKKERERARELRKTRWWQQLLSAGICYYCGEKFSREELTMDHKVPLARGGKSTKGNIVVSCKDCNTNKKAKTPAELELEKIKS